MGQCCGGCVSAAWGGVALPLQHAPQNTSTHYSQQLLVGRLAPRRLGGALLERPYEVEARRRDVGVVCLRAGERFDANAVILPQPVLAEAA